MNTSTFGYHGAQDRIWLSNSGWKERIWLTRRQVQGVIRALTQMLEQSAAGEGDGAARAAREHDASINHPAAGAVGKPLQVGRDTPAQAAEADYALCTGLITIAGSDHATIQIHTASGEYSIRFDREGLHRWLRALYMVLRQAEWNLPDLPEWLTRSYLPPALQHILTAPLDGLEDEEDDPPPAPPSAPAPGRG